MQALHIPDLRPLIGGDLLAPDDERTDSQARAGRFRQQEWFMHELNHVLLNLSRVGMIQQSIAHAIYLLLSGLPAGLTLDLPSWEIVGSPELTRLARRLWKAHELVADPVNQVEEFACTATSLVMYELMLRHRPDHDIRALQASIPEGARSDVWRDCLRLDIPGLVESCSGQDLLVACRVVLGLAAYALDDDDGSSNAVLEEGSRPSLPDDRLAEAIDVLSIPKHLDFRELLQAGLDNGFLRPTPSGHSIEEALGSDTAIAPALPDPVGMVTAVIGADLDDHGQALLDASRGMSIFGPNDDAEMSIARMLSEATLTIPLMTVRRAGGGPIPDCRHALHLSVGDAVRGLVGTDIDGIFDEVVAGTLPTVRLGPIRVMPASDDVVRLWGHERALQQLLHQPWYGLQCECIPGCNGARCACAFAYEPIRQRVRVGHMKPLEPTCLA